MKRLPPLHPDDLPPHAPRGRRALSEEERRLWEAVARSTRPLKPRQRKPRAESAAVPPPAPAAVAPRSPKPAASPPSRETAVPARPKPVPPLVALGRRERSQLSRGKKDIEARLDLHGMTQARAHRALLNFLRRASDDGMTFVLVITGKGRAGAPDSERGVLRRQVPEWLSQADFRTFVVGFDEAHIGHGGGGALYIRIRRRTLRDF